MADDTFESGYNAAIEDMLNFLTEEIERISSLRFPSEEVLGYIEGLIAVVEGGQF